jgi:hypothetical protein
MEDAHDDGHPREADRLIFAGLLGLTAAGVIQLIDKGELSLAQEVGIYAFATAIPLLALGLVTDYARRAGKPIPAWRELLSLMGSLAAVVGLGAFFFHFGLGPGITFAVGSVLGFFLVRSL